MQKHERTMLDNSTKRRGIPSFTVPRRKVPDHVYHELCNLILDGEIQSGQLITIAALSEAFGVSAMPVREALQKLAAKNVLTVISGRTIGVPSLTLERLRDLTRVRLEIEGAAAEWAAERASPALVDEMRAHFEATSAAFRKPDPKEYLRCNRDFHFALYWNSGSETACGIIEDLWLQVSPYLHHLQPAGNFTEGNRAHSEIVEALAAGDAKAVRAGICYDISRASEVLQTQLK
jgi:DNA-binding GntR family transcriptional regulator